MKMKNKTIFKMKEKMLFNIAAWAVEHMDPHMIMFFTIANIHVLERVYGITEGELFNLKDRFAPAATIIQEYQDLGKKIHDRK